MSQFKSSKNTEKYSNNQVISHKKEKSHVFSQVKLNEFDNEPLMTQIKVKKTIIKNNYDMIAENYYGAENYKYMLKLKKDKKAYEKFLRIKLSQQREYKKDNNSLDFLAEIINRKKEKKETSCKEKFSQKIFTKEKDTKGQKKAKKKEFKVPKDSQISNFSNTLITELINKNRMETINKIPYNEKGSFLLEEDKDMNMNLIEKYQENFNSLADKFDWTKSNIEELNYKLLIKKSRKKEFVAVLDEAIQKKRKGLKMTLKYMTFHF